LDTRFKTVFFFYSKIKIKKDHLTLAEKERELKTNGHCVRTCSQLLVLALVISLKQENEARSAVHTVQPPSHPRGGVQIVEVKTTLV
jgi:hypothetical protein